MKQLAALGIGIWLTASGVFAQVPAVCIPLVKSADQCPVIDGIIQGSEWKYATALTGLISMEGSLAQRQAT